LIGLVMIAGSGRPWLGEPWRLLLVTGLLGGFTTFSAFGYETYQLLTSGYALRAALYILASVGLGTFAVFLGAGLGRLLRP
jgi:fluoride exporter